MKKSLIDFYVFSWGMGDVDNIKTYYKAIKANYPSFDLTRIESHIAKLERYKSLKIEDYPILTFNDINIYKRQENDLSYAIIRNDEVVIIDYPFMISIYNQLLLNSLQVISQKYGHNL